MELPYGKKEKLRDPKYLKSYADRACIASRDGTNLCGLPSVGAHIRVGSNAGMGSKPPDNETIPLCWQCHTDSHQGPEAEWLVMNVLKPMARRQYREYKNGKA